MFGFFARQVGRKKIHPAIAVGEKIDAVVRSPHWANILCGIVGQVFRLAGLEIVNPDVVRHSAAIMFPSAELPEDAVVRHLRIIGRERNESATRHRHLLRQLGVKADRVKLADEVIERFHPSAKNDQRLRVLPGHHDIVRPHPIRNIVAPQGSGHGQPLGRAALG